MTKNDSKHCLNCKASLVGDYCHQCGQSAKVSRLTFVETSREFFSSSFAIEGPFLQTIKYLIINPGKLFREYIGGMRKTYYKPVAFFIMLTAIYIIIRSLIGFDPFRDEPIQASNPKDSKLINDAGVFMVKNINNIMFFLVLSIGIFQKLFYWKRYNLVEYLTIGFYISGLYIIISMLNTLISTYVYSASSLINLAVLLIILVYNFYSLHLKKGFWELL